MSVPALIVSGFLGAGKTTLVGHLLAEAQREGVRLAIISNEFGDTGIDRALLDAGSEGLVELDGGCVCCRLSDALGETLEMLLTTVRPDRLLLETSGVALPADVVVQFWRPPVSELVAEEVVAVVVDVERLRDGVPDDDTFVEQIEAADVLVLNKCDLATEPEVEAAVRLLSALSAGQPVLRAVRGEVDPALLFPPDPERQRATRRDPSATPSAHRHEKFTTFEVSFPDGISAEEVLAAVARHEALRAKGFVRTADGLRTVQGVGARIELTAPRVDVPDSLIGTVVLIVREEGHVHH